MYIIVQYIITVYYIYYIYYIITVILSNYIYIYIIIQCTNTVTVINEFIS